MLNLNNKMRYLLAAGALWLSSWATASANTINYDFDLFANETSLTTQYAGLRFSNATVLKSGIGLNEFSFPPHSGDGVVVSDGEPLSIVFTAPVQGISGHFTYLSGLTISAYDSSDHFLANINSAFFTNVADGTGDPGSIANELISISSAIGAISRIVITSPIGSGALALDDLSVTNVALALPEPGTLALLLGVLGVHGLRHCLRRRR